MNINVGWYPCVCVFRSVSHQGSSAQPGTSVDKSQDSVESEDDSANHRKIPKDVLHQALDVILEQSGNLIETLSIYHPFCPGKSSKCPSLFLFLYELWLMYAFENLFLCV